MIVKVTIPTEVWNSNRDMLEQIPPEKLQHFWSVGIGLVLLAMRRSEGDQRKFGNIVKDQVESLEHDYRCVHCGRKSAEGSKLCWDCATDW